MKCNLCGKEAMIQMLSEHGMICMLCVKEEREKKAKESVSCAR
jgi:hypothetical protein